MKRSLSSMRPLLALSAVPLLAAGCAGMANLDLDGYVTDCALSGLFTVLGQEEQRIRANPVARTTALLQRVFG